MWNPPLADKDGNPILDFQGNPRQPWATIQAKVLIDGVPKVYSFGGVKSSSLREFIAVMKREKIDNKDIIGTKWAIDRIGRWDWSIQYLGIEEGATASSSTTTIEKPNSNIDKITEALLAKKDQASDGLDKNNIIAYLSFATQIKPNDINWQELIDKKIIKEQNGKIFIL